MKRIPPVAWQGFIKQALDRKNEGREIAGFLYSSAPYSPDDLWIVFPLEKNLGLNGDPRNTWRPDKAEMAKVKAAARGKALVKIGNVHTHPLRLKHDTVAEHRLPSESDLKFAKKFNDFVRGVIVVDYRTVKPTLASVLFHDQYGRVIEEGKWLGESGLAEMVEP